MLVNCSHCSEEVYRKPSQAKRSKNHFCNKECNNAWQKGKKYPERSNKVKHNCHQCKEDILVESHKFNRFLKGELKDLFCDKYCLANWQKIHFKGEKSAVYNQTGKKCLHCDEVYSVPQSKLDSKFCSNNCHSESRINRVEVVCLTCGEDFAKKESRVSNGNFCERDCYTAFLQTDEGRAINTKNGALSVYSQKSSETKPERILKEWLLSNNIEFVAQLTMHKRYVADFYLPNTDSIIEVYGDYWHANPKIYGEGEDKKRPFNEMQLNSIERDIKRQKFLEDRGHNFYVLWEDDIYHRLEESANFIHNLK